MVQQTDPTPHHIGKLSVSKGGRKRRSVKIVGHHWNCVIAARVIYVGQRRGRLFLAAGPADECLSDRASSCGFS